MSTKLIKYLTLIKFKLFSEVYGIGAYCMRKNNDYIHGANTTKTKNM